jgi:DNA-binding NarL/FixJ family response regulator
MRYVRDGLACAVAKHAGIEIVANLAPTMRWQPIMEKEQPDVVLISAHLLNASSLVRDILTASANSKVVVHGQSDDDENEVLAWAFAGAHGFVAQSARDTEITSVVECIARGEVRYATSAGHVVATVVRAMRGAPTLARTGLLTRREQEVVELLGQQTNKEIAACLGVEVDTIKSHVHNILTKLGVQHRRDAAGLHSKFSQP